MTDWIEVKNKREAATSQFQFNRDIALWICEDLHPFDIIEGSGLKSLSRNFTFDLPSRKTVSYTALRDIFLHLKEKVKIELLETPSITLMMDGWTDKYNALPYFGIRVSRIKEWNFEIITLAVLPVQHHDSESLKSFVIKVLSDYFPDLRTLIVFDATDGAANMLKLSRLLGHKRTTCLAHSFHNLVTTDCLNKISILQILMSHCREIVNALHFKNILLNEEEGTEEEINLQDRFSNVHQEIMLDQNSPVSNDLEMEDVELLDTDCKKCSTSSLSSHPGSKHSHYSLEMSVPTRWNTNLRMIESILDLFAPVNNTLKKICKSTLCLNYEDKELLENVRDLLRPFKTFTKLFSENAPNLSLLPLVRSKIINICSPNKKDLEEISKMKKLILMSVEKRLPISELVLLSAAFDPAVWCLVMKKDECHQLLIKTFTELQESRYKEKVFGKSFDDEFKENGVSSNANEDMRSSLIYEAKIKEIDTKFVYL